MTQPLLPSKVRGVKRADDRRVLNGIFWRLRTGTPRADSPVVEEVGDRFGSLLPLSRLFLLRTTSRQHQKGERDRTPQGPAHRVFSHNTVLPSRQREYRAASSKRSHHTQRQGASARRSLPLTAACSSGEKFEPIISALSCV